VVRGAELSAGGVAERAARPGRVWGLRLALGLAGLLAPLLLLEVALRLAGPLLPGSYQTASFVETHPAFGRRNHPGQGWKVSPEFTTWIEVNSKGLRGPEVDYAKPAGEMRLLVLGDSFTFAEQVNQDETYTQRLEDRLNATGGPTRFRVLNAGSNGWGTVNELVYLAEEGLRYQPDVVVLALYAGNDMSDNYRRVPSPADAERADLALRGVDPLAGPRQLLRRSEAFTLFETGVLAKLTPPAATDLSEATIRPAPQTADEARDAWDITAVLLQRMREVAENRGAKFVVMIIPSAGQVAAGPRPKAAEGDDDEQDAARGPLPGFENPQATLKAISDRLDLKVLDLLPALRRQAARSKDRLYYRVNSHFTAAGHGVTADQLYSFLARQGLVPGE
jgi:lysophospholipase L1-like esterase